MNLPYQMSETNALTPYIKSLFLQPPNFTPDDFASVLRHIFMGTSSDVQTSAFLTALRMRGLDHQPEFIAAAVSTILEFSDVIPASSLSPKGFIDIVGTGGDGQNTFNVSTSAAIVAAGMGLNVCKHGGKASTSSSGSGDLLKSLGVDLSVVNKDTTPTIVSESNFCFLFAPSFHRGMAKVAPIRSKIGIPTIFNILGPLLNPMPIRARILGVFSEELGDSYAKAAAELAKKSEVHEKTMVVYGEIGLDEISPFGRTKCWMIDRSGEITKTSISPADFGLPEHSLIHVKSGTPEQNAEILLHILRQDNSDYRVDAKYNIPLVDYILMNAAALAVVADLCETWAEGVDLARTAIASGAAYQALDNFRLAVERTKQSV